MRQIPNIQMTTEMSINQIQKLIKLWKRYDANFEDADIVAMYNLVKIAKKEVKENK